jgi:hypothetical protein
VTLPAHSPEVSEAFCTLRSTIRVPCTNAGIFVSSGRENLEIESACGIRSLRRLLEPSVSRLNHRSDRYRRFEFTSLRQFYWGFPDLNHWSEGSRRAAEATRKSSATQQVRRRVILEVLNWSTEIRKSNASVTAATAWQGIAQGQTPSPPLKTLGERNLIRPATYGAIL